MTVEVDQWRFLCSFLEEVLVVFLVFVDLFPVLFVEFVAVGQ